MARFADMVLIGSDRLCPARCSIITDALATAGTVLALLLFIKMGSFGKNKYQI
jgi:hypothetical protein